MYSLTEEETHWVSNLDARIRSLKNQIVTHSMETTPAVVVVVMVEA